MKEPEFKLYLSNRPPGALPVSLTLNNHIVPCHQLEIRYDANSFRNELVIRVLMSHVELIMEDDNALQTEPKEQEASPAKEG